METKLHILKATEELIFRYGVRSVTMDDIAKQLGMSKKTIYQSFKEKDEIIHELMRHKLAEDEKEFNAIAKESSNVVEEFFNIMKHVGAMFSKVNPVVFYDLQKHYVKTWNLFLEFKENFILKMVESTLTRGIHEKLIRPDINVTILSRMRMEQIEMGLNPNVFPPERFKMVDVQIAILEHFLYGICTLKGHKLINKYKQITEEE